MLLAYYAHSMKKYNTPEEEVEVGAIIRCGYYPVNPKHIIWRGTMRDYFDCIDLCKVLIATEYKKHVGKGVYDEIWHAIRKEYPVHVLRGGKLYDVKDCVLVDREDWGVKYGKIICGDRVG